MNSWVIRSIWVSNESYRRFKTRKEARLFKKHIKMFFPSVKADMFKVSSVDLWDGDIISAYLEKAY